MQNRAADASAELRARVLAHAPPDSVLWTTGNQSLSSVSSAAAVVTMCCLASGHINGDLFAEWMTWFVTNVRPTVTKPVLLVLDGHTTRFTVDMLQWALDHHVHVVLTHPNSTAWSQVTDRSCFGVLKAIAYPCFIRDGC